MEWLWLIKLLPVLCSSLISVYVLLGGPTSVIPESRVHHVTGAVINQHLSWPVEVSLISDHLLNVEVLLICELSAWVSSSEHTLGLASWVSVAGTEGGLVGLVL